MSRWWIASLGLLLVAGCDRVFDLDRDFDAPPAAIDTFVPLDASLLACPPSYQQVPGGETLYRFSLRTTTWHDAQADCANDTTPSITHLVEVATLGELHAMQAVFPVDGQWSAWTGYARDPGSEVLVFFSSTGLTFGIGEESWGPGEPNAATEFGEETATFIGDDHEMWDGPPDSGYPYICECDGRLVTRTFEID